MWWLSIPLPCNHATGVGRHCPNSWRGGWCGPSRGPEPSVEARCTPAGGLYYRRGKESPPSTLSHQDSAADGPGGPAGESGATLILISDLTHGGPLHVLPAFPHYQGTEQGLGPALLWQAEPGTPPATQTKSTKGTPPPCSSRVAADPTPGLGGSPGGPSSHSRLAPHFAASRWMPLGPPTTEVRIAIASLPAPQYCSRPEGDADLPPARTL